MKANQSFRGSEEAVSPVIGVILMVAITVVLAAVVFVLVGNLTDTSDAAPQVVFTKSGSGNTTVLTVQSTSEPVNWNDFGYSIAGGTACTAQEPGTAQDFSGASNATAAGFVDATSVGAGETIAFHSGTTAGGCTGATFNLVHLATNQIAGRANL